MSRGARRDDRPGDGRIEHTRKREVTKTADWVIDLGPEGGDKGGHIIAEGTPEQVAEEPRSYTDPTSSHCLRGHGLKRALSQEENAGFSLDA